VCCVFYFLWSKFSIHLLFYPEGDEADERLAEEDFCQRFPTYAMGDIDFEDFFYAGGETDGDVDLDDLHAASVETQLTPLESLRVTRSSDLFEL